MRNGDFDPFGMNWVFRLLPAFFVICFILVLVSWLVYAVVGVQLYSEISKHGLKSVIDRVMNGETVNPENRIGNETHIYRF
jgi:hypothetical protein